MRNEGKRGALYQHPGKVESDISAYIKKRNDAVKERYSLFVPYQIKNKKEEEAYQLIKTFFDTWSKWYMIGETDSKIVSVEKECIASFVTEEKVSAFINGGLRNSLRRSVSLENYEKIYVPDVLAEMMYLALAGKTIDEIKAQLTEEVFVKVADFVKEDYTKEDHIKDIEISIINKNVKVQVANEGEETVLKLSNAEHEKKGHIFNFLREYASDAEEEKKQKLIHIRKLILLFFCGEECFRNTKVKEWSFGCFEYEDKPSYFSDEAIELIKEIAQTTRANPAERRKLSEELKDIIRKKIAYCYRAAIKVNGITESDQYWLQYFERIAEKETRVKNTLNPRKLSIAYLCKTAWKEWISFIAMKYVDMGKAVYHFAMPELSSVSGQKQIKIGEVQPFYQNGISSFDYERVKAKEDLERGLSRYVCFAVNNFSRAVCSEEYLSIEKNEDILGAANPEFLPDATHKILQYFGGKSIWEDSVILMYEEREVALAFQKKLADMRNGLFHYTGRQNSKVADNDEIILELMENEISRTGEIYRKKYYVNNVWMFYAESDILKLMNYLYDENKVVPAQIPAFQKIISKACLGETISYLVKGRYKKNIYSKNQEYDFTKNFEGCLYFLLKEIYYYGFLQLEDLPNRFSAALNRLMEQNKNERDKKAKQDEQAQNNLKKRLEEIDYEHISFGEICQYIMTDYNLQNTDKKKHVSAKETTETYKGKEKKSIQKVEDRNHKYKHFRTLLYVIIKKAFLSYLRDEEKSGELFGFLREPGVRSFTEENRFCTGWECHVYDKLADQNKPILQSYYICAHFLSPKYLNHMIGAVKNYIQYRTDIERRAKNTNQKCEDIRDDISYYESILEILEFCMLFAGQISHNIEDYFSDEEYIDYMGKFIQYENRDKYEVNPLKVFCENKICVKTTDLKGKKKNIFYPIGTYHDEIEPILNRNIIMSKLFGNTKAVAACVQPVTKMDFQQYYTEREDLNQVFHRGYCETEEEQRGLRNYQNHKNHIEMTNILIYSELINDLLSQLVSWAYLRERDLMYFQIGYYYVKLYHTDNIPKDHWMRRLQGEGVDIIDGAILYQIAAMYTYELPVFKLKDGIAYAPEQDISKKKNDNISRFLNVYCQGNKEERYGVYLAGLCLFENIDAHDKLINLRNYIDHFKYYARAEKSILELYSQMYDEFLTYDVKLKKSVTYILKNILLRYFVDAAITMEYVDQKNDQGKISRAAKIIIYEEDLHSDFFTYKLFKNEDGRVVPGGETLVKAREDKFIEQLRRILVYHA